MSLVNQIKARGNFLQNQKSAIKNNVANKKKLCCKLTRTDCLAGWSSFICKIETDAVSTR